MKNHFSQILVLAILIGAFAAPGVDAKATGVPSICDTSVAAVNPTASVSFESFSEIFAGFGPQLYEKRDYQAANGQASNWASTEAAMNDAKNSVFTIPRGNQVAFLVLNDNGTQVVVIGRPSPVTEKIKHWVNKPQLVQHDRLAWSFGAPGKKINFYSHHPGVEDPVQEFSADVLTGVNIFDPKSQKTTFVPYKNIIAHTSDLGDRNILFNRTFVPRENAQTQEGKIWYLQHMFRQVFGYPEWGTGGGNPAMAQVYTRDTQEVARTFDFYEKSHRPLAFLIKQPADVQQVLIIGAASPYYEKVKGFDVIRGLQILGVDGSIRVVGLEYILQMTTAPIDQYQISKDPVQLMKEFAEPQYAFNYSERP